MSAQEFKRWLYRIFQGFSIRLSLIFHPLCISLYNTRNSVPRLLSPSSKPGLPKISLNSRFSFFFFLKHSNFWKRPHDYPPEMQLASRLCWTSRGFIVISITSHAGSVLLGNNSVVLELECLWNFFFLCSAAPLLSCFVQHAVQLLDHLGKWLSLVLPFVLVRL